jgi:hypothetical protein
MLVLGRPPSRIFETGSHTNPTPAIT